MEKELIGEKFRKDRLNPSVFLVGSARSGTTLLRRIVDMHPQIAIARETHWITRFFKRRIGVTKEGLVTPELLPHLFNYHRFSHLRSRVKRLRSYALLIGMSHTQTLLQIFSTSTGKGKGNVWWEIKLQLMYAIFPSYMIYGPRPGLSI